MKYFHNLKHHALSKAKPFYSSCFANEDRNSSNGSIFPICRIQKITQTALISFHHCFHAFLILFLHHLLHLFFSAPYTKLRAKSRYQSSVCNSGNNIMKDTLSLMSFLSMPIALLITWETQQRSKFILTLQLLCWLQTLLF